MTSYGNNNLRKLDSYSDKSGVYIFLDEDNIPVYIGVAGKIGGMHSIKDRLGVQLKCDLSNATLIKNILSVNVLLQDTKHQENTTNNEFKKLILEFSPRFIVISLGNVTHDSSVKNANVIEQSLIAIFNSKYNK